MSSLLRLEQQQTKFLKIHLALELAYFSFFLTHLELKQQLRSYTPGVPSKPNPIQTKMSKVYNRFQTKTAQNPYPIPTLSSYLHDLYRGVPPPRALDVVHFFLTGVPV